MRIGVNMITGKMLLIKAIMAFTTVLAAAIMYRRSKNIGCLVFVAWVMLAVSPVFEFFIDPFNAGGTPMAMIPKWKRDWWTARTYVDPVLLSISALFIAFRHNKDQLDDTPNSSGQLLIGWLSPAFLIGVISIKVLPLLVYIIIGGSRSDGFAAAGAGWFAMLGGYMVVVIYTYLSLPSFAVAIIKFGNREITSYMKLSTVIQIITYVISAVVFKGYLILARFL